MLSIPRSSYTSKCRAVGRHPLVGRKTAEGEIESATIKEGQSDAGKVKNSSMSFQMNGLISTVIHIQKFPHTVNWIIHVLRKGWHIAFACYQYQISIFHSYFWQRLLYIKVHCNLGNKNPNYFPRQLGIYQACNSPTKHTVGLYGKYGQFWSPNGTSRFLPFQAKFWFYLT